MRVLQINTVYGTGSTGRIVSDLHHMLLKNGHESYVAYGRETLQPPNDERIIRIGTDKDIYMHGIKTRALDMHGFGSKKATQQFIKKIAAIKPDIIHLHNIHGYYIHIGVLFTFLREYGKPILWTFHDCWPFTGHCVHFEYIKCDRWKESCHDCPQIRTYPASIFVDNSKRNYKWKKALFSGLNLTIITPSKWLQGVVGESFFQNVPGHLLYSGIDLDTFKPTPTDFRERYKLEHKSIILGVANVWEKRKGFDHFLGLSKHLDPNEVIVMVGLDKKQTRTLPANIIGIQQTDHVKELAGIYSTADVFFNPTLEEMFGLTNIEALACGTPVVTYGAGGSGECINESTGCIVKQENFGEAVQTLRKVMVQRKQGDFAQCRHYAEKNFDRHNNYFQYLEVYNTLIS